MGENANKILSIAEKLHKRKRSFRYSSFRHNTLHMVVKLLGLFLLSKADIAYIPSLSNTLDNLSNFCHCFYKSSTIQAILIANDNIEVTFAKMLKHQILI